MTWRIPRRGVGSNMVHKAFGSPIISRTVCPFRPRCIGCYLKVDARQISGVHFWDPFLGFFFYAGRDRPFAGGVESVCAF